MHQYTTDTNADAESVQLELIRKMPPNERLSKSIRMTNRLVGECKAAIRRNHPQLTSHEVNLLFIELNYGKPLAEEVREHFRHRSQ